MTEHAGSRDPILVAAAEGDKGRRLDAWLAGRLDGLSRSRVQALIREGHITLDGRPASPHEKVRAGSIAAVSVPPPEPAGLVAEALPLSVLYEDGDIIVVDKPPGLVVHPAAGHARGTLVNALLHHCRDLAGIGGEMRPGIVHRLDKDTSGALVAAKHQAAQEGLVAQFKAGTVRKEYAAIVHGVPAPPAGRIETGIGRSPHDRKKMSVHAVRGRRAVTHYAVTESFGALSLLEVRIETGRTHQIRVHLSHLGHPVAGDTQYGRRPPLPGIEPWPARQMLHARRLGFRHPCSGAKMEIEAPLPSDMLLFLETLRRRGRAATEAPS
jgi:23S rRNA pseudouridine1911/1915/1917 synthase